MVWYGDLVLDSHGDSFAEVSIEPPTERSEDFRPTVLMARIAAVLEQKGPQAARTIEQTVTGNTASKRQALAFLRLDGYVSEKSPHELLKAYPPEGESQ